MGGVGQRTATAYGSNTAKGNNRKESSGGWPTGVKGGGGGTLLLGVLLHFMLHRIHLQLHALDCGLELHVWGGRDGQEYGWSPLHLRSTSAGPHQSSSTQGEAGGDTLRLWGQGLAAGFALPPGEQFEGVFFGRAKIRVGKFWNWSLEMKENFGIRSLAVAS